MKLAVIIEAVGHCRECPHFEWEDMGATIPWCSHREEYLSFSNDDRTPKIPKECALEDL